MNGLTVIKSLGRFNWPLDTEDFCHVKFLFEWLPVPTGRCVHQQGLSPMTSSLMWLMVVGALQKSALHLQTPASCPCRNINKDRSKLMENELKSAIIIRNVFHYFAGFLIFSPGIGLFQHGQNLQRSRTGILFTDALAKDVIKIP